MNSFRAAATASTLVLALVLAGCSDTTKKEFGLEANPPDAFEVGVQPPLSLPPELGQLQPPNPGQPRPQEVDAAQEGADVLTPGGGAAAGPPSPGGQALLQAAGPTPPAGIQAEVNQNALLASKSPGFVSSLMGKGPAPVQVVNAPAEQQRLQENEALGQAVTTGATPQQPDEPPGLFHRFLDLF